MTRRSPQQQPPGDRVAQQQQMSGSTGFQAPRQPDPGKPQQMGEGSYEGTRDYQERTERYLDKADVKSDAERARPRSEEEAREMEAAEREGRSHSRGED
ncbi:MULTISPECIES: hypothetical protein [Ramlibacter]|uniref:Uncharacterized protein n=1 Tax=Ramlibacter pinisoli TaxID=2682844 RepID=A0A6N8J2X7_9BURK|nr:MULTISPECIES: hypothetical protein [Ramlibacter]MBA2962624.1 hypothetical protein [Ramlibacter sp. CGMCC 1.13660]MVQ32566.1 hypothetical protein [Ramlibacter pinisoli]